MMVIAEFRAEPEKLRLSCKVEGHAGTAPKGEDLVCAAATAYLTQLAQLAAYMHAEGGKLKDKPKVELHEGVGEVSCRATPGGWAELLHCFFCVEVGYHLLARNHPDAVRLIPFTIPAEG